jgi:hypothetical protein
MTAKATRPDYKKIHELAREQLGEDFSRGQYTKWRKSLTDEIRRLVGLPPKGERLETASTKSVPNKSRIKGSPVGRDNRLILESRRGTRMPIPMQCDECRVLKQVFRYSKSSFGIAFVCIACKSVVFGRSFGSVDAMNLAFQGGSSESNRRRF